jgi:predicted nucleotidyltransferase
MTIDPRLHRIVAAQPYPLLFATISGAHLYGFPSPDSDFDLRGAHVLPLEKVVGLEVKDETIECEMFVGPDGERIEQRRQENMVSSPEPSPSLRPPSPSGSATGQSAGEGHGVDDLIEMDIVSHDVKKFFGMLLKKNGYVLEQLFSPLVVHTTPEHEELKAICGGATGPSAGGGRAGREAGAPRTGVVTKHHAHHYFGFAETQWKLFMKESPHRVKPLLYVYRVLLTGIHLMRTGEVEANLVMLNESFRLPYIADLVARKLAGPENLAVGQLLDSEIAFHEAEYQRLRGELQSAHETSQLPELPSEGTRAALEDLLVRVRLKAR